MESNVFQELTIGSSDVGSTLEFSFDGKMGNITGTTTALAFVKTLDPNDNFATTNFVTVDTTAMGVNWNRYSITLEVIPEPSALLSLGLAGLVALQRRRRA